MNHNFFMVESYDFEVTMEDDAGNIKVRCYTAHSIDGATHKAEKEFPEFKVIIVMPIL